MSVSTDIVIAHGGDLSLYSGGTDRISHFASGLSRNGYNVLLVTIEPENEFPPLLRDVEKITVPSPSNNLRSQPIRAYRITKKVNEYVRKSDEDPVVQIEHSTLGGVYALNSNTRFVLDIHDLGYLSPTYSDLFMGEYLSHIIKMLETKGIKDSEYTITVSDEMSKKIQEEMSNIENSKVISNGVSLDKYDHFNSSEVVTGHIGFFGTIHKKLDTDTFVRVVSSNKVEMLHIVGNGPGMEGLINKVKASGLEDKVTIHGQLDYENAYQVLTSCSVLIYPLRRSEHTEVTFPLKVFDYALLNRPMVLDDAVKNSLYTNLKQKNAAKFATPTDRDEFVGLCESLIDNKKERQKLATRANDVIKEYGWDKRVNEIVELYDRIGI